MANKLCYAAGCHRPLPPKKKKFCSKRCYERINQQKKRARKAGKEWTQEDDVLDIPSQKPNVASRRGQVYYEKMLSEFKVVKCNNFKPL